MPTWHDRPLPPHLDPALSAKTSTAKDAHSRKASGVPNGLDTFKAPYLNGSSGSHSASRLNGSEKPPPASYQRLAERYPSPSLPKPPSLPAPPPPPEYPFPSSSSLKSSSGRSSGESSSKRHKPLSISLSASKSKSVKQRNSLSGFDELEDGELPSTATESEPSTPRAETHKKDRQPVSIPIGPTKRTKKSTEYVPAYIPGFDPVRPVEPVIPAQDDGWMPPPSPASSTVPPPLPPLDDPHLSPRSRNGSFSNDRRRSSLISPGRSHSPRRRRSSYAHSASSDNDDGYARRGSRADDGRSYSRADSRGRRSPSRDSYGRVERPLTRPTRYLDDIWIAPEYRNRRLSIDSFGSSDGGRRSSRRKRRRADSRERHEEDDSPGRRPRGKGRSRRETGRRNGRRTSFASRDDSGSDNEERRSVISDRQVKRERQEKQGDLAEASDTAAEPPAEVIRYQPEGGLITERTGVSISIPRRAEQVSRQEEKQRRFSLVDEVEREEIMQVSQTGLERQAEQEIPGRGDVAEVVIEKEKPPPPAESPIHSPKIPPQSIEQVPVAGAVTVAARSPIAEARSFPEKPPDFHFRRDLGGAKRSSGEGVADKVNGIGGALHNAPTSPAYSAPAESLPVLPPRPPPDFVFNRPGRGNFLIILDEADAAAPRDSSRKSKAPQWRREDGMDPRTLERVKVADDRANLSDSQRASGSGPQKQRMDGLYMVHESPSQHLSVSGGLVHPATALCISSLHHLTTKLEVLSRLKSIHGLYAPSTDNAYPGVYLDFEVADIKLTLQGGSAGIVWVHIVVKGCHSSNSDSAGARGSGRKTATSEAESILAANYFARYCVRQAGGKKFGSPSRNADERARVELDATGQKAERLYREVLEAISQKDRLAKPNHAKPAIKPFATLPPAPPSFAPPRSPSPEPPAAAGSPAKIAGGAVRQAPKEPPTAPRSLQIPHPVTPNPAVSAQMQAPLPVVKAPIHVSHAMSGGMTSGPRNAAEAVTAAVVIPLQGRWAAGLMVPGQNSLDNLGYILDGLKFAFHPANRWKSQNEQERARRKVSPLVAHSAPITAQDFVAPPFTKAESVATIGDGSRTPNRTAPSSVGGDDDESDAESAESHENERMLQSRQKRENMRRGHAVVTSPTAVSKIATTSASGPAERRLLNHPVGDPVCYIQVTGPGVTCMPRGQESTWLNALKSHFRLYQSIVRESAGWKVSFTNENRARIAKGLALAPFVFGALKLEMVIDATAASTASGAPSQEQDARGLEGSGAPPAPLQSTEAAIAILPSHSRAAKHTHASDSDSALSDVPSSGDEEPLASRRSWASPSSRLNRGALLAGTDPQSGGVTVVSLERRRSSGPRAAEDAEKGAILEPERISGGSTEPVSGKRKAEICEDGSRPVKKRSKQQSSTDKAAGQSSTLNLKASGGEGELLGDLISHHGDYALKVNKRKPARAKKGFTPVMLEDLVDDEEDLFFLQRAVEARDSGRFPALPEDFEVEEADQDSEAAEEEGEDEYCHPSGCAMGHGYYKNTEVEKSKYLPQRNRAVVEVDATAAAPTAGASSRSARVATRRFAQGMEQSKKTAEADSDLFAFNQLRSRKKQLRFSRSPIHDWGLYAMESITAGEMVIEYVGEVIRAQVADIREKWYEKIGIGSSYLFRVDDDAVIDATKKGSMARLINHCCAPNCTAKIITINGEKKIVIYAKTQIHPGDEITYDYHFPIEAPEHKVVCLCGSSRCRGFLN